MNKKMKTNYIAASILLTAFNNLYTMKIPVKSNSREITDCRLSAYWRETFPNTKEEDQREPWHMHSFYIAEPLCTVSNLPFFLAAYAVKNAHPLSAMALALAGSASAISHTIPYQFLNDIDKAGAVASFMAVTYEANLYNSAGLTCALQNQKTLFPLLAIATIKLADTWIARGKQIVRNSKGLLSEKLIVARKPEYVFIHVLWHLLAAWTAYALLTNS